MGHTYIPTNWINKKTQLNADNMNKIEEELARLARESGGITQVLEGPGVQVTAKDETSVIIGLKSGTSSDNLLVLDKDNGLILTLSMGYDPETRKLVLRSGSGWSTEVDFDVDKAVVDGNYDPETRNIVLSLSDNSEVIIDMSQMRINWKYIDSKSIRVIEDYDEDGLQTFQFECRISERESNNLVLLDDGLYSEGLDWRFIGVSQEEGGLWEFDGELGFKYWYFESGRNVYVDKNTIETKTRTIDYYNFGYKISTDTGNRFEVRNGKLYAYDEIPEEKSLRLELERLEEEYTALKSVSFRSSETIKLNRYTGAQGSSYIKASVKLSGALGNELVIQSNGLKMPPYTPKGDEPDLTPYVTEVEELEVEVPRVRIAVNNISESIYINE